MGSWVEGEVAYTDDQLSKFKRLILDSDAIGMYLFYNEFDLDKDASAWSGMFSTFKPGTKVKQGAIVNDLIHIGRSHLEACIEVVEDILGIDDVEIIDIVAGLRPEALDFIEERLDPEMVMDFNKLVRC